MPLRSSLLAVLTLLPSLLGACTPRRPWQQAGWRPERPAQRIVLGSVLAAESLLGVLPPERIAAVHFVAATPSFSLVAGLAEGLPTVGASPSQLLSAHPDLVIVDAYTQAETLALLASADVPVMRTADPHSFDDIAANLRELGQVTGLEKETEALVAAMQGRLAELREAGRGLAEWRLLGLDGALHTYGTGSLFDALVKAVGARNLAAEHDAGAFRKLDVEAVLAWRPDVIVIAGDADAGPGAPPWLQQTPGLSLLPCVQRGRVIVLPLAELSTTSHRLVEAVSAVQRQLLAWGKP
ncbi:MAG: ABC transporter substrate-binding protein [Planctomycetota bacterium]